MILCHDPVFMYLKIHDPGMFLHFCSYFVRAYLCIPLLPILRNLGLSEVLCIAGWDKADSEGGIKKLGM